MQERFIAMCPEAHLLMLFVEKLAPSEAVTLIGCQQYNVVRSVKNVLQYHGPAKPLTEMCSELKTRLASFQIFINPQDVNYVDQYKPDIMQKELVKAYCGFNIPESILAHNNIKSINTGNWGVGSYGGNLELRFALQWIASTVASKKGVKRKIIYYTEGNDDADQLPMLIKMNSKRKMSVYQGWHMLLLMAAEEPRNRCSLVGFAAKLSMIFRMLEEQGAGTQAVEPARPAQRDTSAARGSRSQNPVKRRPRPHYDF